jgi:predicted MFS family arabinose efflux permease
LETANSWFQGAPRLGLLIGAPLAGLLVATTGSVTGMYVDATSFALAALLVGFAVPRAGTTRGADRGNMLRQLAEGMAAIRQIPVIGAMTAFVFVTNLLDDAFTPVLLPVYSRTVLGGGAYLGWLLAASSLGAVLGTFGYGPASRKVLRSRRWTLFGCFAVIGLLRLAMVTAPGLLPMIGVSFVLGLAAGPLNPLLMTVMFQRVPEALLGRILALSTAVAMSAAPLGNLAAGWAVAALGLRGALACFGSGYLLLLAISLGAKALKDMDVNTDVDTDVNTNAETDNAPEKELVHD